jgi:molybdopterin molybdotransferase
MQEDVEVVDGAVILLESIRQGSYIRSKGSDFLEGQELVATGAVIDPGVAALLAFVGRTEVQVFTPPVLTVVTTGDELVAPSDHPTGSQIRDTNSVMLALQGRSATMAHPRTLRVDDRREHLSEALKDASKTNDVILVAGGASVGDRDYLGPCMADLGEVFFHGVSIRPGKPVLFGQIGDCFVFGLPGNPSSAFVCFEIFVREALHALAGWNHPGRAWLNIPVSFSHKAAGRDDFVRVLYESGTAVVNKEQGSFGISSLASVQALARFPAEIDTEPGYSCPVIMLTG